MTKKNHHHPIALVIIIGLLLLVLCLLLWIGYQLWLLNGGLRAPVTTVTSTSVELTAEERLLTTMALLNNNTPYTQGAEESPVVITEFSDFECPFCAEYYRSIYSLIQEEYISTNQVRYQRRSMPLYYHNHARVAEHAALCAGDQDAYWPMHDLLFERIADWTGPDRDQLFLAYSTELELNGEEFSTCMEDRPHDRRIDQDLADAIALEISGVPTIFINETPITNLRSYEEDLRPLIEEALAASTVPQ